MNPELIRERLRAQPFEPFEIRMSNGDVYLVKHPDFVLLGGNRLHVYSAETDQVNYLSVLHVVGTRTLQETH